MRGALDAPPRPTGPADADRRGFFMRQAWEQWNASMPPIPPDATISLGYGAKDMPQR